MLSAVILSRHSYGAVPLAWQPPDQRSVHFGPLVTLLRKRRFTQINSRRFTPKHYPRFLGAQTISSPVSARCGMRVAASYPYEQSVSRTDSSTHESSN